jgi:hypothetical protein
MADVSICTIPNCSKPHLALGLCRMHYNRQRRGADMTAPARCYGVAAAFIVDALATETDECIDWPFRSNESGYARGRYCGKMWIVSRLVCILAHGEPDTPSLDAAHSCGRGHLGCINKRHLRWATSKENSADSILHGTMARGTQRWNARLNEDDVRSVRLRLAHGEFSTAIARDLGVSSGCIDDIKSRKNWSWLK